MKLLILIWVGATLTIDFCRAADPTAAFYVSPQGSDAWSGTLAAPNAARTDGPFATLERARDAIRGSADRPLEDVVVLIRGGTYRLKNTIVFGPQDSFPIPLASAVRLS